MSARVLVTALLAAAALITGCSAEPSARETNVNSADVEFARGMLPHHEQAIDMADMVPRHTRDQAMLDLADQVRTAQQPEIERLRGWLRAWNAPEGHGEHRMSGMMSPQDMTALGRSHGPEFDRMWLRMMIEHHRGAIEMARRELDSGRHPDAKAMAENIIRAQRGEIEQMTGMLD